jgi:hypothetical protein
MNLNLETKKVRKMDPTVIPENSNREDVLNKVLVRSIKKFYGEVINEKGIK